MDVKINTNNNYSIYGLGEPHTDIIKYIGISKDINKRYGEHLKDCKNSHKRNWILKLNKQGYSPTLCLIEDDLTLSDALEKEKKYILIFKSFGANLANLTIGGEAPMSNKKHKEETKKKMSEQRIGVKNSFYGKKHNEKTREIISLKNKGRESWCKGKKFNDEHKKKLSEAKINHISYNKGKTRFDLEKIRQLYQNGLSQHTISKMYNTDQGTISRIVNKINYN